MKISSCPVDVIEGRPLVVLQLWFRLAVVMTPTISTVSLPTVPAFLQIARLPCPVPTDCGLWTLLIFNSGAAFTAVATTSADAPINHFVFLTTARGETRPLPKDPTTILQIRRNRGSLWKNYG